MKLGSRHARQVAVATHRFALLLSLVLATATAAAAPEPAPSRIELPYAVAEGIPGCLSEPAFDEAVRARLPDHSFVSQRPIVVATTIERDQQRLRATVTLREEGETGAASEASQELVAGLSECATLSAAAALAVALAIERSRARAETPPVASPEPISRRPPEDEAPRPRTRRAPSQPRPPRAPEPVARELRTDAVLAAGHGVLPSTSLGTSFGTSLKITRWSAGLEAGAWLPATVESSVKGAGAKAWLVFAGASACAHAAPVFVCGLAKLGDFRATGTGRLLSRSTDATYVALGARIGAEVPLARPFSLVIHGGVLAPLLRPALRIEHELLWRAPLVGGELAMGLRMSIL